MYISQIPCILPNSIIFIILTTAVPYRSNAQMCSPGHKCLARLAASWALYMRGLRVAFLVCALIPCKQAITQVLRIDTLQEGLSAYKIPGIMIEETNYDLPLAEVIKSASWKEINDQDSTQLAATKHWFQFLLTNGSTKSMRIGFYNYGSQYSHLYVCTAHDTLHLQSGEFIPANKLQFLHDGTYNSFAIEPGDTVLIAGNIRFTHAGKTLLYYGLYNIGYYHRYLVGDIISRWGLSQYQGFVLGALVFALLFISLIGVWFKNDSYGYYILFLLGGILFVTIKGTQFSYLGMLSQYLGTYRASLSETLQFLFFAAYATFVIKLLHLKRYPKLHNLARGMVAMYCCYAGAAAIYVWVTASLAVPMAWYIIARIVAFGLSIVLVIWISKVVQSPIKKFYIAGTVSFLAISFIAFIRQSNPDTFLSAFSPVWYLQTAILIEAILFGLALGYQMYLVEKEKRSNYQSYIHQLELNEKLMHDMNEALEKTVAERTAELAVEKEKQLRTEYEQQITQLEMQALRSQMNPHFIFNSLASIRYQIQSGQYNSAMQYLLKFSQLLRLTLENSRKDTVTLDEELQLTRLYLDIEGYRFGDAFSYSLDIAPGVDPEEIELPPLLLQPYAENAIKHGLMESQQAQKKIVISVQESPDGYAISIEDNGIGRAAAQARKQAANLQHSSLGMQITSERMKVFTRKYGHALEATIEDIEQQEQAAGTRVIIHYKPKYNV